MPLILGRKKLAPPVVVVPTDDAGLMGWYTGGPTITTSAGLVTGWTRSGGVWPVAAPPTAARRPTTTTIAGKTVPLFDGVNDAIDVSFPVKLLPAFTIMVVSTMTVLGTYALLEISDNPGTGDRGPRLHQSAGNRIGRQNYSVATDCSYAESALSPIANFFTCQAVPLVTPATTRLYRGATQMATQTNPAGTGNDRDMIILRVGCRVNNTNNPLSGTICEFAVWDNVLSPTRVAAQAGGCNARFGTPL